MSTRGAIGFRIDGIDKVTYNHSDSYPSWLGREVLQFLAATPIEKIFAGARQIQLVGEDDRPTPAQILACKQAGVFDDGVGSQSDRDWYCLLRGAQGELDKYLAVGLMIDGAAFLSDSLFCEWAYIVNCDTSKLEVYRGANRDAKAPGRYVGKVSAKARAEHRRVHRDNHPYYGVELLDELDIQKFKEGISNRFAKRKPEEIIAEIYGGWGRLGEERYEDQRKRIEKVEA